MKKILGIKISLVLLVFLCSWTKKVEHPFMTDEFSACCIIDFDSLDRTPEQRISMLK